MNPKALKLGIGAICNITCPSPASPTLPSRDSQASLGVPQPPGRSVPSSCRGGARMNKRSIKQTRHCHFLRVPKVSKSVYQCHVWITWPAVLRVEGSADCDLTATWWQVHHLVLAALPHGAGGIVFIRNDEFQFLGNARKKVAVRKGELNRAGSFCSWPMTPLTKELTRWHTLGHSSQRSRKSV